MHKTLAAFATATAALALLAGGPAAASVWLLGPTANSDGNVVSASANITTVGDLITIELTNLTADMFASNQAISDLLINFTTDVGDVSNFTQAGQLGNIDDDGNVTFIGGVPTRWDPFTVAGNTYLDVLGGGKPNNMIASLDIGDPNGGLDNFNPYIMGTGTFTMNLPGASLLKIGTVNFSFGTNHEFVGGGNCTSGCTPPPPPPPPPPGGIPEPTTWALMILGFGGAGAMLRRARRTQLLPT